MDKYDVFISCTRQDENCAREIYNFLMDNHLKVFMPSENLSAADDSDISAISEAISQSTNMIVFASFGSSFQSRWVEQEWRSFQRLKEKGLKSGKIVLILQYISPEELEPELRQFETIAYDNYKWNLLQILQESTIVRTETPVSEFVIPPANKKPRLAVEKYDVFISCKSEDYASAEEIYNYLVANHVKTFLASTELRRIGESEYRRAITDAMKDVEHLIIYASRPEYIDSKWVFYEWDMFVTAKIKGFKQGNIVTVLNGVNVDDINMALWSYESIVHGKKGWKEHLLKYVSTEASEARAREAEERRQAEEQARLQKIKSELIAEAEKYAKSLNQLKVDARKIQNLMRKNGITERKCPVCQSSVELHKSMCPGCGWIFSPIEGIEEVEYLLEDKRDAIRIRQDIMFSRGDLESQIDFLNRDIERIHAEHAKEKEKARLDIERLRDETMKFNLRLNYEMRQHYEANTRVAELEKDLDLAKQQRQTIETKAIELKDEVVFLRRKLSKASREKSETEAAMSDLKKQLDELRESSVKDEDTPDDSTTQATPAIGYSIYIKSATTDSIDVIRKYNSELTEDDFPGLLRMFSMNVYMASFPTLEEAKKVKNTLESYGATVEIRYKDKIVETSDSNSKFPRLFSQRRMTGIIGKIDLDKLKNDC